MMKTNGDNPFGARLVLGGLISSIAARHAAEALSFFGEHDMYQQRDIRHAIQDRADLDAKITGLRAEARKLLGPVDYRMTAQEQARVNAIDAEINTLTAQAANVAAELAHFQRLAADERNQGTLGANDIAPRARGRKFAEMFPAVPLSMGGFQSNEEFLATIHSGLVDPRLQMDYSGGLRATAQQTIGVPSEGGFSVPTQTFAGWLDSSLESEIVRSRADIRPMTSSDAVAPGWDDGDHADDLYGGFTGQWLDELGTLTPQAGKLRLIKLHARKLGILIQVSNELIADGMSFEQQLGAAIPKALGWFLDRAFFTGNGANKPLGIHNADVTVTVAKETNQAANTINYTNIAKMFARMPPSSYPNSVWVCNSTAIPQLLQLSMPIGTSGSHIPVLNESNGEFRMLTRPVVFTEKVPALGTVGDIGFYDFTQYVVGMRAEFSLAKSQHVGFATDSTYYRGIIRVDGQPKRSAALTPANGDALSPFVLLATRS